MDFKYLESIYNSEKILDEGQIQFLEMAANGINTKVALAKHLNEELAQVQELLDNAGVRDIKIFFSEECVTPASRLEVIKTLKDYLTSAKVKLEKFGDSLLEQSKFEITQGTQTGRVDGPTCVKSGETSPSTI